MSAIKIVITGVMAIVIQFGLAIAAWGGWGPFFRQPAFRALAAVTVVLAVLAVFSGGGMSSGEKEDRGNRWVLGAFSVIALLMAFFSSYTDRIGSGPLTARECAGWELQYAFWAGCCASFQYMC